MTVLDFNKRFLQAASGSSPDLHAALQQQQRLSEEVLVDQHVRVSLFECSALLKDILRFVPALVGNTAASASSIVPNYHSIVLDARARLTTAEEFLRDRPQMQETFAELCKVTDQVLSELDAMFRSTDR